MLYDGERLFFRVIIKVLINSVKDSVSYQSSFPQAACLSDSEIKRREKSRAEKEIIKLNVEQGP